MDFVLQDKSLRFLYEIGTGAYPQAVIKAFFKRMAVVKNAKNEMDLRNVKGARFEKLKGQRTGEYSMRLDDGWRLIFEISKNGIDKIVIIKEISNHYQ